MRRKNSFLRERRWSDYTALRHARSSLRAEEPAGPPWANKPLVDKTCPCAHIGRSGLWSSHFPYGSHSPTGPLWRISSPPAPPPLLSGWQLLPASPLPLP